MINMASTTFTISADINMVRFYKDTISCLKKEKIQIKYKLERLSWYNVIKKHFLSNKLKDINFKILNNQAKLRYYKRQYM